jgi:hypothetical protein
MLTNLLFIISNLYLYFLLNSIIFVDLLEFPLQNQINEFYT